MDYTLENTVDKLVAKDTAYGIFLKGEARFKGYIANTARMRIENKDITISVFTVPIDDNNIALLINEIKREEYTLLQELETDQQINAIKSVYLKNNLKYSCSKSVDCQMMTLEGKFRWVKLIFSRINTGNDDDFRVIFMFDIDYFKKVGNITVSFGVIEVKADESPSDAFKRIDSALYEAKKNGRNKVVTG